MIVIDVNRRGGLADRTNPVLLNKQKVCFSR